MAEEGFVPGAAVHAPELEMFMKPALIPPENFVGNLIFPDAQVVTFEGFAPKVGNEEMEVYEDDIVAFRGDFPQVQFSQEEVKWGMGYHGREIIIDQGQLMKADDARAMAIGFGNPQLNPLFDLESRSTNLITAQNLRRNEFIKMRVLQNTALPEDGGIYPAENVFDPIEIDTAPAATINAELTRAVKVVNKYGRRPANLMVWGDTAWDGLLLNTTYAALMPNTEFKVMTPELFQRILRLPTGIGNVQIATAQFKKTAKSPSEPMFGRFVWIGAVGPQDGTDTNFGANLWRPCRQNKQRFYVNRRVAGNIENIHIAIQNFYQVFPNVGALGVLIPITLSTDE